MFLISSCSCLCPVHWSQVLSRLWRCSWSSADRGCSNDIWVINKLIAYKGVTYIRGMMILDIMFMFCYNWNFSQIFGIVDFDICICGSIKVDCLRTVLCAISWYSHVCLSGIYVTLQKSIIGSVWFCQNVLLLIHSSSNCGNQVVFSVPQMTSELLINSLATGRYGYKFELVIFNLILRLDILSNSCDISLWWMSKNLYDE